MLGVMLTSTEQLRKKPTQPIKILKHYQRDNETSTEKCLKRLAPATPGSVQSYEIFDGQIRDFPDDLSLISQALSGFDKTQ